MRRRVLAVHLLGLGAAWVFLSWAGATAYALGVAATWQWGLSARFLEGGAACLMAAVPFLWLGANRHLLGVVTSGLVTEHPWPGRVAAMSLALAALGLLQEGTPVPSRGRRRTGRLTGETDDA